MRNGCGVMGEAGPESRAEGEGLMVTYDSDYHIDHFCDIHLEL